jgi:hypothetical protein
MPPFNTSQKLGSNCSHVSASLVHFDPVFAGKPASKKPAKQQIARYFI